MYITDDIRKKIHLYAILNLAIKSVQHDQKLFKSFKIYRPYLAMCEKQLKELTKELKDISRQLYKTGIKYERYQRLNENECIYSFLCRGEIVPFQYNGNSLLKQVEKKINISLQFICQNQPKDSSKDENDVFRGRA